ncbi:type II toxin-antitoxin system PemK/MazF family toxin [Mesorhizobium sp. AR07]|uniref:type II toxin-antitoxin system PemK/MazF family toxin n=1 Tax=Mesorhizobium sp. AR07 TaxID=2865838 RepID=UPI0039B6FE49
MGKEGRLPRPVVILSFKNTLHGHVTVLPVSTDPQEGKSAEWAHKLSIKVDGHRDSWVVCNHLYTFSTKRLGPAMVIPRIPIGEFNDILAKVLKWLPKPSA